MKITAFPQFALCLIFLFTVFSFVHTKAFAARNITVSSDKTTLHGYDEMTVHIASLSGFVDGETIYIKAAFYKDGSTNYFGLTKNGDNWIKNSDAITNQRQIEIGNWDRQLVIKSDFDDSGYTNYGEGDYKVKIGFYYLASSGSFSSINWSANSLDVSISSPDPTPTPTPNPTSPPTATSKPTATPTPAPTAKPSLSPTSIHILAIATDSAEASDDGDLFATDDADLSPMPIQKVAGVHTSMIPTIFIIIGGVMLIGYG